MLTIYHNLHFHIQCKIFVNSIYPLFNEKKFLQIKWVLTFSDWKLWNFRECKTRKKFFKSNGVYTSSVENSENFRIFFLFEKKKIAISNVYWWWMSDINLSWNLLKMQFNSTQFIVHSVEKYYIWKTTTLKKFPSNELFI